MNKKKKTTNILSFIIAAAMVLSAVLTPTAVFAAITDNYFASFTGELDKEVQYQGQDTILFHFNAQTANGAKLKTMANASIIYNNEVLELLCFDGTVLDEEILAELGVKNGGLFASIKGMNYPQTGNGWTEAETVLSFSADGTKGYFGFAVDKSSPLGQEAVTPFALETIRFGFRSGKTLSDVDNSTIRIMDKQTTDSLNYSSSVILHDGTEAYCYGMTNGEDTLSITEFSYPGSDKKPLLAAEVAIAATAGTGNEGLAVEGTTLTASVTCAAVQADALKYTWVRTDEQGTVTELTEASGINKPTYTAAAEDAGKSISVRVSDSNLEYGGALESNKIVICGTPEKVTDVKVTQGNQNHTITWSAPAANGSEIKEYKVYSSKDSNMSGATSAKAEGTSLKLDNLTDGDTWYYQVAAVNGVGEGTKSEIVEKKVVKGELTELSAVPAALQYTYGETLDTKLPAGTVVATGSTGQYEKGTPVSGKWSWADGTMKPDASMTSAKANFVPDEVEAGKMPFVGITDYDLPIQVKKAEQIVTIADGNGAAISESHPVTSEIGGDAAIVPAKYTLKLNGAAAGTDGTAAGYTYEITSGSENVTVNAATGELTPIQKGSAVLRIKAAEVANKYNEGFIDVPVKVTGKLISLSVTPTKTYDGTTRFSAEQIEGYTLTGKLNADHDVSLTGMTGEWSTPAVGNANLILKAALTGADAGAYDILPEITLAGSITKATLDTAGVTVKDKASVYNGSVIDLSTLLNMSTTAGAVNGENVVMVLDLANSKISDRAIVKFQTMKSVTEAAVDASGSAIVITTTKAVDVDYADVTKTNGTYTYEVTIPADGSSSNYSLNGAIEGTGTLTVSRKSSGGGGGGGGGSSSGSSTTTTGTEVKKDLPSNGEANIGASDVKNAKSIEVKNSQIIVNLNQQAVNALDKTTGLVIKTEKKSSIELNESAKELLGSRPVFDVTATQNGKVVTSFGSGKITISIAYAPASGEEASKLFLYYINDQGEAEKVSGSKYDSTLKAVTGQTSHLSIYGVGYDKNAADTVTPGTNTGVFRDVSSSDWFYTAVMDLAGKEIVSGVPDEDTNGRLTGTYSFRPQTNVTRAEFVAMLAKAAGADLSTYSSKVFNDVNVSDWYAGAAAWASSTGVASGTGDGNFSPNANITRQDMAVMVNKYVANVAKTTLMAKNEKTVFTDAAQIADYASGAVETMQTAGILSGVPNEDANGNLIGTYQFRPFANATRAEAASMLSGLLAGIQK